MRINLPTRTVRFRLTVLFSALFLAAGAALLAITYVLVDSSTDPLLLVSGNTRIAVKNTGSSQIPSPGSAQLRRGTPSASSVQLARQLYTQAAATHARDLRQLLAWSGVALGIMAVLAIGLGWVTTGRVLRPLRSMKAATQRITESSLHERLDLPGPDDEMKDLADTIDGLLARLETAFESQRRFVASASHELRTPLTFNRALLEVALADPDASADDLRATCAELLTAGEHQERLIEALLALATSERGLDRREPFDLAIVTRLALAAHYLKAGHRGLRLDVSLGHVTVHGDPDLTQRMAANLIDNAIQYNLPGGSVSVRTENRYGHAVLTVANTGWPVPADKVDQLFEPFQRLIDDRASHPDGHGLGLSIVRAIADAHDAILQARSRPQGGLVMTTRFPPPSGPGSAGEAIPAGR
ncbi:MAG TPA: ATP-binding protein [Streptosporangiaceae bacterium]|nr:ATP-binding protein [Streptosporangiaceae bacterium]